MKTDNLVNGYVVPNLLYELMFLHESGIEGTDEDWADPDFLERVIRKFVQSRYETLQAETKMVVKNTLSYLLATQLDNSDLLDRIWQASSAPIPTPRGVRDFIHRCFQVLFPGEGFPTEAQIS